MTEYGIRPGAGRWSLVEANSPVSLSLRGNSGAGCRGVMKIRARRIRFAFEDAAVRGAELIAVHSWNHPRPALVDVTALDVARADDVERALLSEELAGWRDKYPDVPVQQNVVRGRATPTLLTFARYAQVLVVGTRGRGGFAGMVLGSTSHALICHALCPVVVVRPDSLD